MFGFRELWRSYLDDAKLMVPTQGARRLRRYAANSYEYRRLRLMVIMSQEFKYLYMVNPKVASTSVRNVLHRLNGFEELVDPRDVMGHERSGFQLMRDLSMNEFCDIVESLDFYRFSFVRNPFSRLVSGYVYFQDLLREKVASGKRRFGFRVTRRLDPRRDSIPRRFLSFSEFIEDICLRTDIVHDLHFRPQSDVLLIDHIQYDFIGKLESFEQDMKTLLTKLNAPADLYSSASRVTNASRDRKPVSEWFTPKLADLVRMKFARDFENFSYNLDVPGAQSRRAA